MRENEKESLFLKAKEATNQKDWNAARALWDTARAAHSDRMEGYVGGVSVLLNIGALDEAEGLNQETIVRFPDNPIPRIQQAKLSMQRQNWAVACELWHELRAQFPHHIQPHVQGFDALINLGQLDDAEKVNTAALKYFPNHPAPRIQQANLAMQRQDMARAAILWEGFRAFAPSRKEGYVSGARSLMKSGQFERAAEVLLKGFRDASDKRVHFQQTAADLIEVIATSNPENASLPRLFAEVLDCDKPFVSIVPLIKFFHKLRRRDVEAFRSFLDLVAGYVKPSNPAVRILLSVFDHGSEVLYPKEITVMLETLPGAKLWCYFTTRSSRNLALLVEFSENLLISNTSGSPHLSEDALRKLSVLLAPTRFDLFLELIPDKPVRRAPLQTRMNHQRKLRIAVCVSGQLRGFRKAFQTWSALALNRHDTIFFTSAWRSIGRKFPTMLHAHRSFDTEFLVAYRNTLGLEGMDYMEVRYPTLMGFFTTARDHTTEAELQTLYGSSQVDIEDDVTAEFAGFSNPQKMYYKVERCWKLFEQSGLDADLVIRVRPDKPLKPLGRDILGVDWHEVLRLCREERTIFADAPLFGNFNSGLAVGDQFAVGIPEDMQAYSTVYSRTKQREGLLGRYRTRYMPHGNFAYTLLDTGLNAQRLPGVEFSHPLDPERLNAQEIFDLLSVDISGREATQTDRVLLNAARVDAAL